jgi:hypothetical protein
MISWQEKNIVEDVGRSILDMTSYLSIQYRDQIRSLCEVHLTINFENLFSKDALPMKIVE